MGRCITNDEYEAICADGRYRTRRVDARNKAASAGLVNAQNELAFRKRRLADRRYDAELDPVVALSPHRHDLEALRRELGLTFPVRKQVDARDEQSAAHAAVRMIADGEAQLLMKGNLHTSTILSSLLHRDYNLRPEEAIISHVFILESRPCGRLLFVTDSAVNIAPDI
ncbi:MAG: hypothetical protein HGB17_16925, partial [Syntrophobacteraceae bacterium]|nr:hypothetical protein [Syntrophobacteraceae bacterium]